MASCSCGTRDKPKPVSPLSRGLSWLGCCMRLAFRNGADRRASKNLPQSLCRVSIKSRGQKTSNMSTDTLLVAVVLTTFKVI